MKKEFKNILIIGDPHASSKRIGRRKEDYSQSVINKLRYAAKMSRELSAYTICLGDFFHFSGENNIKYLYKLAQVLKEFYYPLVVNEGNHDKFNFQLDEGDTLSLLALLNALELPEGSQQVCIAGVPVNIGYISHGTALPDQIEFESTAKYSFLITHHDLAMGSSYPGSIPLKEIKGIDFVINGHMHKTEISKKIGSTWYHNPGNIEPLSIDLKDFDPKIWAWSPHQDDVTRIMPIDLPHDKNCFQLTGFHAKATKVVVPDSLSTTAESLTTEIMENHQIDETTYELEPSQFAEKMSKTISAPKTEDASILEDDVEETLETGEFSEDTKKLFRSMLTTLQATLANK